MIIDAQTLTVAIAVAAGCIFFALIPRNDRAKILLALIGALVATIKSVRAVLTRA